jgi:carboxyl-terminal processing protease
MQALATRSAAWILSAALAWGLLPTLRAETPAAGGLPPASAPVVDPDAALKRGLDFERERNWQGALDLYDEAASQWPSRAEFGHRRRLCEIHQKLTKRYQDQSFRSVLLKLSHDKSLELYDEVLERIDSQYVDPVPVLPLLRRGLDNVEVALRDPEFLSLNSPQIGREKIDGLRTALRARRDHLTSNDRSGARAEADAACELARNWLGIAPAAIVLEFIYGACDALDDYTACLTPDKLDDLYAMIDGNFVGLGVELKKDESGLKLVGVIRGGPAWEAGIKVGDRITAIAGLSVKGQSLDQAANRLQGNEGTAVELEMLRADGTKKMLRLVRRPVEVESIAQARIVEPTLGIGYVQLTGFQKTSTEELEKAIGDLQKQGLRYLVLDLRGNPGGLLNVAVEMADRFLGSGVIVSTRGRAYGQTQVYQASGRPVWTFPMSVLVDRDSASASEILAGALQELRRATVLGERSYGKGSVQSIFSLRTVPAGLKLTTAKFYSPTKRAYSEQGVTPDVVVTVRARPVADRTRDVETATAASEFGQPDRDQVLSQAITQARRRLTAAR